jgi:large subunit ribosomal protein L10
MAHVADWKQGETEALVSLLTAHKIIGIIDIGGIPAPQLQKIRGNIRKKATIRSAKNTLIIRALDEADKKVKGLAELKAAVSGQAAIIASDTNPFSLFKDIKSTRTKAPAKGGETAQIDIEIKEGETPFKPGPIVGELQKAGIPAAIQEGKVVIKTDKVLVKAGDKIPRDMAQMLTRLEIYPIELGLNVHAVYEKGSIFKPEVLDIDMDKFMADLQKAYWNTLGLALEAGWTNKDTIDPLLQKAYRQAYTLAMDRSIINKETVGPLMAKAKAQMEAVSSLAKKPGESTPKTAA